MAERELEVRAHEHYGWWDVGPKDDPSWQIHDKRIIARFPTRALAEEYCELKASTHLLGNHG